MGLLVVVEQLLLRDELEAALWTLMESGVVDGVDRELFNLGVC